MLTPRILVQREDFDTDAELRRVADGRTDIGAVVSFTGLCRDDGGRLAALELEHYPGMAEAEIARIAAEAAQRWPLQAITVIHRSGRMRPGDRIVLVVTASLHRQAAFAAAEFLMDFMKTRAPFWKKEERIDGAAGNWVAARQADDDASRRWRPETADTRPAVPGKAATGS